MKLSLVGMIALVIAYAGAASAFAVEPFVEGRGLLADAKDLTLRCVIQPVVRTAAGAKEYGALRSRCSRLQEVRGGARLRLRGQVFQAVLVESEDADGGDLAHLLLIDSKGDVAAQGKNVLAFGNIFIALAGGEDRFAEVEEDRLLSSQ